MAQFALPSPPRWYHGITSAQWLILALASAGWVFDVYEGQIFNITRAQMLKDILGNTTDQATLRYYGDVFLAVFLAGGTLGGVGFGALADRWGRRPTLILTIALYSLFSGMTYFATTLTEVGVLRFLVAMGVGGEWSVAAALIAETFPPRARAQAAGIFHATSILGTWLAGLAGLAVGAQWRYAYLLGALPALLIVWVRAQVAEPEAWAKLRQAAPANRQALGSLRVLLTDPRWRRRAVLGLLLAATGLGTFWGVTVAGQDLAVLVMREQGVAKAEAEESAKFAYGIVQTAGGGLGLLAFGPLAVRWGRRRTFLAMQMAAVVAVAATCYVPTTYGQLLALLPVYGFCTLGLHAGFAIYFPELFPTSLRATGAGFCFNGGRLVAAPILIFSGWLKAQLGDDLRLAIVLLSSLFLAGMLVAWVLPETKDQPLPEDAG